MKTLNSDPEDYNEEVLQQLQKDGIISDYEITKDTVRIRPNKE